MSAIGPKWTRASALPMSAFRGKAHSFNCVGNWARANCRTTTCCSPTLDCASPLSPNAVSAAAKIGMPDVTFHGLRHTHASQLIDQQVDIVMLNKRLGYAKLDITLRIYAHSFRKDDSKVAGPRQMADMLPMLSHETTWPAMDGWVGKLSFSE